MGVSKSADNVLKTMLLLLLMWVVPATALAEKPQGPITVQIKAVGKAKPGATVSFDVTAVSLLDGEMTITLFPPPGAKVTAGELRWRGEVAAHGRKKVSITVELPATENQEFRATATMVDVNGARFGAGASYPIASKATATSKQKKSLREGQEIIEVPVPAKR